VSLSTIINHSWLELISDFTCDTCVSISCEYSLLIAWALCACGKTFAPYERWGFASLSNRLDEVAIEGHNLRIFSNLSNYNPLFFIDI